MMTCSCTFDSNAVRQKGLAENEEKKNLEWENVEEKTGKRRKHFEEDSNNQKENVERKR